MPIELNIVLVRPIYPSNIGATARVMGNMGINRLILVDAKCEINSKAKQGAAGAQDYLKTCTTYSNWEDFYTNEGKGVRIGLTRRRGKLRHILPLSDVLNNINIPIEDKESNHFLSLYLIFGPEDHGLSTEDLSLVNFNASLPTYGNFPSMNLSHAVLLASYITQLWIHKKFSKLKQTTFSPPEMKQRQLFFPDKSIRNWLEAMGFDLEKRRSSAYTTLKRILLQNLPTENELHVLEAILQQNTRKLRKINKKS